MKSYQKRRRQSIKNGFQISGQAGTPDDAFKPYLKPRDISLKKAARILGRLNSFESSAKLENAIRKLSERAILRKSDAQRLFLMRTQLGEFLDLRQIMAVKGIGAKKFTLIVRALDN